MAKSTWSTPLPQPINQNDKNSQTTLIYETPEPRQHVAQQQHQPQPKKE